MKPELSAELVAARLLELRGLHVPEDLTEARARLARETPRTREPFEVAVARQLEELRALCELARHLHQEPAQVTKTSVIDGG